MPSYNFKKKVKFYVVVGTLKYAVDVYPDVSFAQTYEEKARKVKTLHTQTNMFDEAIINEANPASFNFTMPIYTSLELKPILSLLLDYDATSTEVTLATADIYVDTGVDIFKLQTAVFERGTFNINRDSIVTVSISGTASRLYRFGASGTTIPGTLQSAPALTATPVYAAYMLLQVNAVTLDNINGVSIEVANDVSWTPNNNLHKSLVVTGPSDTVYPGGFVVSGRTVSGTVQQYLTDTNVSTVQDWKVNVPLNLRIGVSVGVYTLQFNLPQVVYTNRIEPGDIFFQNYDFRLTSSPSSLSTIITYT